MSAIAWMFLIASLFLVMALVIMALLVKRAHDEKIRTDAALRVLNSIYLDTRRDLNDRTSELTLAHLMVDERDLTIRSLTEAHQYMWTTHRGGDLPLSDRVVTTAQSHRIFGLVNDHC